MPTACDGTETLAVRVMDYDWGKRDDMLGECVVRLGDLLARDGDQSHGPEALVSTPLCRKGKSGDLGEVTLSAARDATTGLIVVRCHRATGLRKGDWGSKNDVYVQAYAVDASADPAAHALPEADKNVELPAGRFEKVFGFTIPAIDDLPASLEGPVSGADYAYVRYSVYSNIDVKMRLDPSTRRPITLLTRGARLPPPAAYAPVVRGPAEAQIIYKCPCCVSCGLGCAQGTAQFQACVSQAAVSVGDVVYVAAQATNSTEIEATFHVELVTKIRITRRNGSSRNCRRTHRLGGVALPGNSTINFGTPETPVALKIPGVPPPFAHSSDIDSGLVLVRQGSPGVLRFDQFQALQGGMAAPLTCHASYPGYGIGNKYPKEKKYGEWRYIDSKVVAAQDACMVQLVQGKFLKRVDADLVLDVSCWKFQEGTAVSWVGGKSDERTYLAGGGRDWQVNEDGSISLVKHPHLCLGSGYNPLTWAYALRLTIDMPGGMTDVVWEFPVSLTALPTATVLAQPQYAPLAAKVVAEGVDETAAPQPGDVYEGQYPTQNIASAPAPITNRQEDEHNYNNGEKGPPPPFQPIYMGAVEPTPCAFVLPAHASAPDAAKPSQVAAVSDSSMAPAALEMADR